MATNAWNIFSVRWRINFVNRIYRLRRWKNNLRIFCLHLTRLHNSFCFLVKNSEIFSLVMQKNWLNNHRSWSLAKNKNIFWHSELLKFSVYMFKDVSTHWLLLYKNSFAHPPVNYFLFMAKPLPVFRKFMQNRDPRTRNHPSVRHLERDHSWQRQMERELFMQNLN